MNSNSPIRMIVVGSTGIDDIATPFEMRKELLGGSVSYACAAASFFTKVGMVGVVGDDFSQTYRQTYEGFGIDLSGLQQESGKTFRWSGVYHDDMINRDTLSTELNVFESFSPDLPEQYRSVPFLLLGNIQPELQLRVLEQCRDLEFVVADTMDLWIDIARESLREVISRVHMLTLNDSEARLLTSEHNLKKAALEILEMGPKHVVIKKGEHGAMLVSRDEEVHLVPAYPVDQIVDPTGAGDAFAGAFLGALAKKGDVKPSTIRPALVYGSIVASFSVEAFSLDRLVSLTLEQINDRYATLERMCRVH